MISKFFIFLLVLSSSLHASEEIIRRQHYTLSYNEDHEVANWVSYEMDHSKIQNCVKRTNNFKADPLVSTGSAVPRDYKGSGYDRGHLLPAGDMKFSQGAMNEAFFLSNITPQPAKFNQVRWNRLESLVRAWVLKYEKLWIVTGPILSNNLPTIGYENQISIPDRYFKVLLRKKGNSYQGIALIMSTDIPYADLKAYVTTIDQVEDITGDDYFQFLKKSEQVSESKTNIDQWDFTAKFEYLPCRP